MRKARIEVEIKLISTKVSREPFLDDYKNYSFRIDDPQTHELIIRDLGNNKETEYSGHFGLNSSNIITGINDIITYLNKLFADIRIHPNNINISPYIYETFTYIINELHELEEGYSQNPEVRIKNQVFVCPFIKKNYANDLTMSLSDSYIKLSIENKSYEGVVDADTKDHKLKLYQLEEIDEKVNYFYNNIKDKYDLDRDKIKNEAIIFYLKYLKKQSGSFDSFLLDLSALFNGMLISSKEIIYRKFNNKEDE